MQSLVKLIPIVLLVLAIALIGCAPSESSGTKQTDAKQNEKPTDKKNLAPESDPKKTSLSKKKDPPLGGLAQQFAKHAKPSTTGAKTSSSTAKENQPAEPIGPWPGPDDRFDLDLDIDVIDQDEKALKISDLNNKPMVASFIFTRCANEKMCPLIVTRMAELQARAKKQGIEDKVQFVLISYDPNFDTPEKLKSFGVSRGLEFGNARMLRPDPAQLKEVFEAFEMQVAYREDGTIANHLMELYVIDTAGRQVRWYRGMWNNDLVLEDLTRLVEESKKTTIVEKTKEPKVNKESP